MSGNIIELAGVGIILGGTSYFFGKKIWGSLQGVPAKNHSNAKPGCGGCSGCGSAQAIPPVKTKTSCH